ncbi:hypothetical protein CANCADRAFT_116740 [Tortispora caseinolytica NRRL Y-17796]|uniref:Mitochondrial zinc maintenance protein 1, mitochondrial n=1 Tax=Tortispora caseinolytica NRRL Y-17796 TaxID=767744 RepID=A0A1E4TH94_9ASCO|nr:hypothetical protein CANCADRAFT_116740 [Tortispora caseinolytica NRRL Y-17796]
MTKAVAAYRNVWRAINIAFKEDVELMTGARMRLRSEFEANRNLIEDKEQLDEKILHANAVATLLRQNLVQGKAKEGSEDKPKYVLRLHEEIELGDNETIFQGKTKRDTPTKLS